MVASAKPPLPVLESMLAVRLHLDSCTESNGPLRISPGTHHRHGFAPVRNPHARRRPRAAESLPFSRNPHTIPEKFRTKIEILSATHENASLRTELTNGKLHLTVAKARQTLSKVELTIAKSRHATARAHLAIDGTHLTIAEMRLAIALSHLAGNLLRLTRAEVRRADAGRRLTVISDTPEKGERPRRRTADPAPAAFWENFSDSSRNSSIRDFVNFDSVDQFSEHGPFCPAGLRPD